MSFAEAGGDPEITNVWIGPGFSPLLIAALFESRLIIRLGLLYPAMLNGVLNVSRVLTRSWDAAHQILLVSKYTPGV